MHYASGILASLTLAQSAAIAISLVALLVSIYGVRERKSDRYRQQRLRLSELVDELSRVTSEQAQLFAEKKLTEEVFRSLNRRRSVLCDEASGLLESVGLQASSQQLLQLAHAKARLGDIDDTRVLFQAAVDVAPRGSSAHVQALREYAYAAFFVFGSPEEGREVFEETLEVSGKRHDDSALMDVVETYLLWARAEAEVCRDPAFDRAGRLLAQAVETIQAVRTVPRARAALRNVAEAQEALDDLRKAHEDRHSVS